MREHALRHQVVSLDGRCQVGLVDADRDAHQHVLRPLDDLAVDAEQVGALKGLSREGEMGGENQGSDGEMKNEAK